MTVKMLSVAQRKLSTHRGRLLKYRTILLTVCKLPIAEVEASRITCFVAGVVWYLISLFSWHSLSSERSLDGSTCKNFF